MCEIANGIVFLLLCICSWCDWRKKEIPMHCLLLMTIVVGILAIVCPDKRLWSRLGGGALGVLFFLISKVTKEAIGYGDSWLILILGVQLGLSLVLQLLLLASLLAGVVSLFILLKKRWKKSATIPFVPFLLVGYLGVMFL